ncbi:LysR family transcriptional regulator [Jiella sonneratiae]|uniref:LysR family transcriptional regulator n=1 Tax=Jiella sonneratiae TaxID=2816856 RepID=A0ABS3J8Q1_9HYPH|nr:LysR family transcriptional regulator [Jiella sonneratiae]MBO0906047.1 LysR family transcriptional regulator [Jiella sonneratiae]
MDFNLRHLRIFADVVSTGSITQAAGRIGLSQPAVTQAIGRLEAQVGTALLDRAHRQALPTAAGAVFAARSARALALFDEAAALAGPRLSRTATTAQLSAFVALVKAGRSTDAARSLGIAQPTLHRAAAAIQKEATRPLFERTSRGLVPTRLGSILARAVRLAYAEMEQARMEVGETEEKDVGAIAVGAMPLSRAFALPVAVARFRARRPSMTVRIVDGPYAELLDGLEAGVLDFLVGALRDPLPSPYVEQEALFSDDLVVVCGAAHPLAGRSTVSPDDIRPFPFVVAVKETPTRRHFDRLIADGAPWRPGLVETGSTIFMREIMSHSEHLGCVSRRQAEAETRHGGVHILPLRLPETERVIGLTTRRGWHPTRSQAELLSEFRRAASV